MQIRPGGEKLSDTKVGEFDRRPLLFRLSAMQPMQRAFPPIITDPVIRTSAACCWWNRLLCSRRTKQEWEGKLNLFHFREESCNFFFLRCCCQEMNKWLSMFGGEISHLLARFSQLILFSPYKAGNEISLCAVSPLVPPPPPPPHLLYLFIRSERKEPPLRLQTEKLSSAITCRTHQSRYTQQ